MGQSGERQKNVDRILLLKAHGLNRHEIAERLGLAAQTVSTYLSDPDNTQREEYLRRRRATCPVCGGAMWRAAKQCSDCQRKERMAKQDVWSANKIIDSIRRYHAEFGCIPPARDFYAKARDHKGEFPTQKRVDSRFGSWANAVEAAGFPRPSKGGIPYSVQRREAENE